MKNKILRTGNYRFNLYGEITPILRMLIFSLFSLYVHSPAYAATYVYADKEYLVNVVGWYPDGQSAVDRIVQGCTASGYVGCSGVYTGEIFSSPSWYYTYTLSYLRGTQVITSSATGMITYFCPVGYVAVDLPTTPGKCMLVVNIPEEQPYGSLKNSSKSVCECSGDLNVLNPSPTVGNPIVPSNATKVEFETDYANATETLYFTRLYRSSTGRWEHNYESFAGRLNARLSSAENGLACVRGVNGTKTYCYPYASVGTTNDFAIRRGGGKMIYASSSKNYLPSADANDRIAPTLDAGGVQDGWDVVNGETDALEHYDLAGLLVSSALPNGQKTTYSYSDGSTSKAIAPVAGLLITVTDAFGKQLSFSYDEKNQIAMMTDPSGGIYRYGYDSAGNMTSVTYPDLKSEAICVQRSVQYRKYGAA